MTKLNKILEALDFRLASLKNARECLLKAPEISDSVHFDYESRIDELQTLVDYIKELK